MKLGPAPKTHYPRQLGLRRDRTARPVVKLRWKDGIIPAYPATADHFAGWKIGLDDNDRFGVCGPTSLDNHRRLTTKFLTGREVDASQADVFDLYRRSGNPNFDPVTGRDDNGVVMSVMMEAAKNGGLGGVKLLGYASLADISDPSVFATIHALGGVLFGVDLEVAQQAQTDAGLWDYSPSREWGGHAIVAASYDSTTGRVDVGTWAERVGTTGRFRSHQLGEVWLPLWPELVTAKTWFDSGYDLAQFAADWLALTGQAFPGPVPPPAPPPNPPQPPSPTGSIVIDLGGQSITYPGGWTAAPSAPAPTAARS